MCPAWRKVVATRTERPHDPAERGAIPRRKVNFAMPPEKFFDIGGQIKPAGKQNHTVKRSNSDATKSSGDMILLTTGTAVKEASSLTDD